MIRKIPLLLIALLMVGPAMSSPSIKVVATLQDFAAIAEDLGGDRVQVRAIVAGNSDPHFIKPKPSYAMMLRDADLLIATGLDLELWVPVLVNKSGNRKIVDGAVGYVAAAHGIEPLQKPTSLSRSAGDVHIYGNPHIHTSPINAKIIARNIATGLCKVDPEGCPTYEANLRTFVDNLSRRLYGDGLVDLLGTSILDKLARRGELLAFLRQQGIADELGGWLHQARSLQGQKVICYHRNWAYFATIFGLNVVDHVETKPGIPPSARHVAHLMEIIPAQSIGVVLSANYFERRKPELIAARTGIVSVVVPLSVGGEEGVDSYEELIDLWITRLVTAFGSAGFESLSRPAEEAHGE